MKMRRTAAGWEYQCDQCGRWGRQAWLIRGRLLDVDCVTRERPETLAERVETAVMASRALMERARELRLGRRG